MSSLQRAIHRKQEALTTYTTADTTTSELSEPSVSSNIYNSGSNSQHQSAYVNGKGKRQQKWGNHSNKVNHSYTITENAKSKRYNTRSSIVPPSPVSALASSVRYQKAKECFQGRGAEIQARDSTTYLKTVSNMEQNIVEPKQEESKDTNSSSATKISYHALMQNLQKEVADLRSSNIELAKSLETKSEKEQELVKKASVMSLTVSRQASARSTLEHEYLIEKNEMKNEIISLKAQLQKTNKELSFLKNDKSAATNDDNEEQRACEQACGDDRKETKQLPIKTVSEEQKEIIRFLRKQTTGMEEMLQGRAIISQSLSEQVQFARDVAECHTKMVNTYETQNRNGDD